MIFFDSFFLLVEKIGKREKKQGFLLLFFIPSFYTKLTAVGMKIKKCSPKQPFGEHFLSFVEFVP